MFSEVVGWTGVSLVVVAYFLVSTKKLPPQARLYQSLNLLGAIGIGVNVFTQKAYSSLALQIIWAAIAIYGLYKASKH